MPPETSQDAADDSSREWRALLAARRNGRKLSLREFPLLGPLLGNDPARPYVIAQLGQSLDGRIATASGESKYINCRHGLTHLHRLRALVDAIVIGATTAIADDPGLDVRLVEGDNPARVVLDPCGRVPATMRLFREDGARRVIVIGQDVDSTPPEGVEVIRLPRQAHGFAPAEVVRALHVVGLRRLLVEGGAETVSRFIDARALDRLHLMVAPVLLGEGPAGVRLVGGRALSDCMRPATRIFTLGDDTLFDCDFAAIRASDRDRQQVDMADL